MEPSLYLLWSYRWTIIMYYVCMWLNVSSMRREKAKMISSWMKQESLKPFFGFLEIKVWDVIVCLKISGEIEAVWWQKPPQITQTSVVCRSFLQPNNSGAFKCGHNRLCWCFNNNRVNCRLHNNVVYICTVVLWRECMGLVLILYRTCSPMLSLCPVHVFA